MLEKIKKDIEFVKVLVIMTTQRKEIAKAVVDFSECCD